MHAKQISAESKTKVKRSSSSSCVCLNIGGIEMELRRKKMKYLRVAVKPPLAQVKVSAPIRASRTEIEKFLWEHLDWIKQQQQSIMQKPRPPELRFDEGETHYYFGREVRLNFSSEVKKHRPAETVSPQCELALEEVVELKEMGKKEELISLYLTVGRNTVEARKQALHKYYRAALAQHIPTFIAKYEPLLGVQVNEWRIKRMKTRWGTCNITDGRIWLNLGLAHYPLECLEYVVVHEMAHLLERHHNQRFWRLISRVMPGWQVAKGMLKQNQFG